MHEYELFGKAWYMHKKSRLLIMALTIVAGVLLVAPASAFASYSIHTPTKAENKAYNRCVNVANNYAKYDTTVTVDISDLGLSKTQVENVEDRVHGNGELWWINTFALKPTTKSFTIVFKYSDSEIKSMRKKFESAIKAALKCTGPGMSGIEKVHMIHDWIIRKVDYKGPVTNSRGITENKDAYFGIVKKRGDCFGYTLTTDVLMRRAGFSTDTVYNEKADHSWNLVKVGSYWYHVDTTWDRSWTYKFPKYYGGKPCHKWMLQSDKVMNWDEHAGWRAHHKAKSSKYLYSVEPGGSICKHCNDYKHIVRSFSKGGLKFAVTGVKKVYVKGVAASSKSKKTLDVPASVTYKSVKYKVRGIKASAFSAAKVKTLTVNTKQLAKARVKNSLLGSKITKIKAPKGKRAAYRKIFAKANSGKSVKVS